VAEKRLHIHGMCNVPARAGSALLCECLCSDVGGGSSSSGQGAKRGQEDHRLRPACSLHGRCCPACLRLQFVVFPDESHADSIDLCLVLLDIVLETLPSEGQTLKLFGILKILRFLRLFRVIKQLANFRDLYLMVMGMIQAGRATLFGTLLLFLSLTMVSTVAVYAIRPVAHSLAADGAFGDCDSCAHAFDDVFSATLTLFSMIMAGDGAWRIVAMPIIRADAASAIILITAMLWIQLGLMNTIAAVVVYCQVHARENDLNFLSTLEAEDLKKSIDELATTFRTFHDEDGTLHLEEFLEYYDSNENFRVTLNRLDVFKSDVPTVFKMLDSDESQGVVFTEFVDGLQTLRSQNTRTLQSLTNYFCERIHANWTDITALADGLNRAETCLRDLNRSVSELQRQLGERGMAERRSRQSESGKNQAEELVYSFADVPHLEMDPARNASEDEKRTEETPEAAKRTSPPDRSCFQRQNAVLLLKDCADEERGSIDFSAVLEEGHAETMQSLLNMDRLQLSSRAPRPTAVRRWHKMMKTVET